MRSVFLIAIGAVAAGSISAQIGSLATTWDGSSVYFSTVDGSLRQRGSQQPFSRKLFLLRDNTLTLIEDSQDLHTRAPSAYDRPAVNANASVLAVNRSLICHQKGICDGLQVHSTVIYSRTDTFTFPGRSDLTANGRFALITYQSVGVQLLDLATGKVAVVGSSDSGTNYLVASSGGHFVSEDGTVLIGIRDGVQLIGPSSSGPLRLTGFPILAIVAGDASRILYETTTPLLTAQQIPEIRVFDVKTGADRSLASGHLIALAGDGRSFSYLRTEGASTLPPLSPETQVWLGDAIDGISRQLSNEPDGVSEQTITGDGRAVIAATRTGRVLSIDTTTGTITQLLGSPGPETLFTVAVPGSYNEVVGVFPNGPPEILIGANPAVILGRSPRGYAIQIPWEAPYYPIFQGPPLILRGSEPLWERQLSGTVQDVFPRVLPVGPTGPDPLSGALAAYNQARSFAYAIHEDWSGPVSGGHPARPGEIIHFYGSGWGPVDGTVQTGQPTPTDRPYNINLPCDWRATGASKDPFRGNVFSVTFAGLAPGLVGVYQLDFRIPPDWSAAVFDAFCVWSSGSNTFYAETAAIDVRP